MKASTPLLMQALAAAVLGSGLFFINPAANAQDQPSSPGLSNQKPADQKPVIADEKLDAAAAALQQVATLKQDYQRRLEAAAPAEKERIADEGKNALIKAVTDQGISVDEYTAILIVAQNDPAIGERILQRIRK